MSDIVILSIAVGVLAFAVVVLFVKFSQLRNEVTEGKYLIAEKDKDGGFTIKNSKGKIIFEL